VQLLHGTAVADDHQPQLRWHARMKSTSTTSLKVGPDGRTAPVLNFSPTTESFVSTASLLSGDKAADGAAATAQGSGCNDESVELSVPHQITSLAMPAVAAAFPPSRTRSARTRPSTTRPSTGRVRRASHCMSAAQRAEAGAAAQMTAVQTKSEQLREVQQLLRRLIAQVLEVQNELHRGRRARRGCH
jgi:hypothetical protein